MQFINYNERGILSLSYMSHILKNELKLTSESGFIFDGFDYNGYVYIKDSEIGWFIFSGKSVKYSVCGHVAWATGTVRQVTWINGLAG